MKRKATLFLCLVMLVSLLAGCARGGATATSAGGSAAQSNSSASSGTTYKIRVGHVLASEHPYTGGLKKFAELVSEKTNGAVTVDVFSDAQLGNERDMVEGLQLGTLEMALVSTAPLSGFTDDFLVFDLPYIFTDTKTARACVDSEIGSKMLDSLSTQGIKGLVFFENGFRNVTNSKRPIVHPSDLKGIKIRTMENDIQMATFSAMGADPTPMAFGELFTALQQKTIDAQENPLAIIDTSKFYEVQKYLSITEHFYAPAPLLMSQSFWDSLPKNYQDAILESAQEARDYERSLLDDMNTKLLDKMKEQGMEINDVDKAEFRKAVQPVYDQYTGDGAGKVSKDLLQQVQNFKA